MYSGSVLDEIVAIVAEFVLQCVGCAPNDSGPLENLVRTGHRCGLMPATKSAATVANKELDRTYFRLLSAFTTVNTGDVIEARQRGSLTMMPTLPGASIRCHEIWGLVVQSRPRRQWGREDLGIEPAWY